MQFPGTAHIIDEWQIKPRLGVYRGRHSITQEVADDEGRADSGPSPQGLCNTACDFDSETVCLSVVIRECVVYFRRRAVYDLFPVLPYRKGKSCRVGVFQGRVTDDNVTQAGEVLPQFDECLGNIVPFALANHGYCHLRQRGYRVEDRPLTAAFDALNSIIDVRITAALIECPDSAYHLIHIHDTVRHVTVHRTIILIFTEFPGEVLGDESLLLEDIDNIGINVPIHLRYLLDAFRRILNDFPCPFFIKTGGTGVCVVVVFFKLFGTHSNQIVPQCIVGVLSACFRYIFFRYLIKGVHDIFHGNILRNSVTVNRIQYFICVFGAFAARKEQQCTAGGHVKSHLCLFVDVIVIGQFSAQFSFCPGNDFRKDMLVVYPICIELIKVRVQPFFRMLTELHLFPFTGDTASGPFCGGLSLVGFIQLNDFVELFF